MATRRRAGKTDGTSEGKSGGTTKITLAVPVQVATRFNVHAAALGIGKGQLFEQLVNAGCRRFRLTDFGQAGDTKIVEPSAPDAT